MMSGADLQEGHDIEILKDLRRQILRQLRSLEALDQECTEQCKVEGVPPPSSLKPKETSASAMLEGLSASTAEQGPVKRDGEAVSVVSRASSSRSRRSDASNASRAAVRDLEIANLSLTQQRVREESEKMREEQEREEEGMWRRRAREEYEARRRRAWE